MKQTGYQTLYEINTRVWLTSLSGQLGRYAETRAASAFDHKKHQASAMKTYLSPGLRFFHQGQFEGTKKRISPHLIRAPREQPGTVMQKFYYELLSLMKNPVICYGKWQLLDCMPSTAGNETCNSFIAFVWESNDSRRVLVIINYSDLDAQCYIRLLFPDITGRQWKPQNLMGKVFYERNNDSMQLQGLYLDMIAWEFQVFELKDLRA